MLPPAGDQLWLRIVNGSVNPELTVLACRLAVAKLRRDVQDRTLTPAAAAKELHGYFAANAFAHRELNSIRGLK